METYTYYLLDKHGYWNPIDPDMNAASIADIDADRVRCVCVVDLNDYARIILS